MDRRASALLAHLSSLVATQVYDGRLFDPASRAASVAIDELANPATGTISVDLYKGNMTFHRLTDCPASIYNEADSSMEASDGLNPGSSQGYAEVQSVEALALARAGQIR
jgi:argininosuccinate synthase